MWEPRHPSLKVVWYIPSVRGAGRAIFVVRFIERRRNDATTLGGSDWSQSRIWRQIDVLVGVYDVLRPRGTTSGAYQETGEMRIVS